MERKEIDKETMKAMRTLTDLGGKVAQAKHVLSQLEEKKEEFIKLQKLEVIEEIDGLMKDSKGILDQIAHNNSETVSLYNSLVSFVVFIEEAYRNYGDMVDKHEKYQDKFTDHVKKQQEAIGERKKELQNQAKDLAKKKEELKAEEKDMSVRNERILSRRVALNQAIADLKKDDKIRKSF